MYKYNSIFCFWATKCKTFQWNPLTAKWLKHDWSLMLYTVDIRAPSAHNYAKTFISKNSCKDSTFRTRSKEFTALFKLLFTLFYIGSMLLDFLETSHSLMNWKQTFLTELIIAIETSLFTVIYIIPNHSLAIRAVVWSIIEIILFFRP